MIVLDTDHLSLLQRAGADGERVRTALRELQLHLSPPTTVITYEEQIRGWMASLSAAKTMAHEIQLYRKLSRNLEFFATLTLLDFTELAAVEFQRLRAAKVRIGTMDLKIAAIALANGATLWTRNRRDFQKVPGLRIDDATR